MDSYSGSSEKLVWIVAALTLLASGCRQADLPPREQTSKKSQRNSIGMVLMYIPSGSFFMGDTRFDESSPVHRVTISGFWIGKYEVTNAEFDRYQQRPRPPESSEDRQPTTQISWQDAVDFCQWLSKKEGRSYRLPTEAQWEYAARGGLVQKDYPWGNGSADGRARAGALTTAIVGSYAANRYGLHDMAGNVEEWVSDWYDPNYYKRSPEREPPGPAVPPPEGHGWRITRGGGFSGWEPLCWLRTPRKPEWRFPFLGFRIMLVEGEADAP